MMVKAYLTRKDNPSVEAPFLFNPTELSVEKSNQFTDINIPGLSCSVLQFVRGNSRTVSMDLFFDTYELGTDVRLYTDRITGWDAGSMLSPLPDGGKGLMDIDSELHAPPVCYFMWGEFIFQCIIERVSKRFTMFLPEGIPVRATLSVSLKEYKEVDIQVAEIAALSSDLTKRWVTARGDRLWSVAHAEFGDPADWRLIAETNDIDNPRLLAPGADLEIPVKE